MSLEIGFATAVDAAELCSLDTHIPAAVLGAKIARGEIVVAREDAIVGWLRFGWFWDGIPMMNMLVVSETLRGQGIGTRLIHFWEQHLRALGHSSALTSTLASERGQFLYRRLGYVDCGVLLLPGEPAEVFLRKELFAIPVSDLSNQ